VDVRLSPEQVALRDAAVQVVDRLGPHVVADLEDTERVAKLDAAVTASGWRELRMPSDEGGPWASAVEVAVVAEELGRSLADVAFVGPTMAADLRRLAGAAPANAPETIVLTADLSDLARSRDGHRPEGGLAVDERGAASALTLVSGQPGSISGSRWGVGSLALARADDGTGVGVDLTRVVASCPQDASVVPLPAPAGSLEPGALTRWLGLGLAVTSADLVGVMRGALALAAGYARARRQYGAAIGSFQAIQHLLADAQVAIEGSRSVALHAAWAVDALPGPDALATASSAKAYCGRAARAVCETAIQVHGGIGNTWECLAHVYLRRALLSTELFGGIGVSLDRVLAGRGIEGDDGLR
jgi:alkylation response protein AidB-like acyl-CoA dehydrogenase